MFARLSLARFAKGLASRWLPSVVTLLVLATAGRAEAELRVVATTPDLAAIAVAVGAHRAQVTALAQPSQDPHFVDAKPHLALELGRADLLLVVGAELEVGWLPTLLTGSRNGNIQPGSRGYLDASTLVDLLEAPLGKVDRSMGDVHPQGSPHFLLDPRRAERVAVAIGKRLSELDPAGHDAYLDATKAFLAELRTKRVEWESRLKSLRGKPVVGYHRSLAYLADWLGLEIIDCFEPKPGIPPNPRHVAQVIDAAKARHVGLVLQESWFPTSTAQVAAAQMGARLVVFSGSANFQAGQSYVAFLDAVVSKLEAAR